MFVLNKKIIKLYEMKNFISHLNKTPYDYIQNIKSLFIQLILINYILMEIKGKGVQNNI